MHRVLIGLVFIPSFTLSALAQDIASGPGTHSVTITTPPIWTDFTIHDPGVITMIQVATGEVVNVPLELGPPSGSSVRSRGLVEAFVAPPGPCTALGNNYRLPAAVAITGIEGNLSALVESNPVFRVNGPTGVDATLAEYMLMIYVGPTDTAAVGMHNGCDSPLEQPLVVESQGGPSSTRTVMVPPREYVTTNVLPDGTGQGHGWSTVILPHIEQPSDGASVFAGRSVSFATGLLTHGRHESVDPLPPSGVERYRVARAGDTLTVTPWDPAAASARQTLASSQDTGTLYCRLLRNLPARSEVFKNLSAVQRPSHVGIS